MVGIMKVLKLNRSPVNWILVFERRIPDRPVGIGLGNVKLDHLQVIRAIAVPGGQKAVGALVEEEPRASLGHDASGTRVGRWNPVVRGAATSQWIVKLALNSSDHLFDHDPIRARPRAGQ